MPKWIPPDAPRTWDGKRRKLPLHDKREKRQALFNRACQRRMEAWRLIEILHPIRTKMQASDRRFVEDIQAKRLKYGIAFECSERTLEWLIDLEERYVT